MADVRDRVHPHFLAALDQALQRPGEVIDVYPEPRMKKLAMRPFRSGLVGTRVKPAR
jgi:hypothetical protein